MLRNRRERQPVDCSCESFGSGIVGVRASVTHDCRVPQPRFALWNCFLECFDIFRCLIVQLSSELRGHQMQCKRIVWKRGPQRISVLIRGWSADDDDAAVPHEKQNRFVARDSSICARDEEESLLHFQVFQCNIYVCRHSCHVDWSWKRSWERDSSVGVLRLETVVAALCWVCPSIKGEHPERLLDFFSECVSSVFIIINASFQLTVANKYVKVSGVTFWWEGWQMDFHWYLFYTRIFCWFLNLEYCTDFWLIEFLKRKTKYCFRRSVLASRMAVWLENLICNK